MAYAWHAAGLVVESEGTNKNKHGVEDGRG